MIAHQADISRRYGIPLCTLRQWVKRGHLTRLPGGRFDLEQVLRRLDTRDTRKDRYHRI